MKKKITIGMFVDTFFPMIDGVAMVVDNYAKRLSKVANVIVFAPFIEGYNDDDLPYKVVRCKSIKPISIDYSLPTPRIDHKFMSELKEYHLDIVHIHSPFTIGRTGLRYAKKNKVPLIGTMHSQLWQDFYRSTKSKKIAKKLTDLMIRVYNKCDECWTVNKQIAKIYIEDYGYNGKIRIINNATDMKPLKDINEANTFINKKHKIKENEKVFLYVGRINKLKNIFFIVDSLEKVKEKDKNFKFKMIFVGSGQDEEELKTYVKKKKLTKDIIFAGKVTNRETLAKYYNRSDLFLFPSKYDTNSLVQIEAASQKTPTLFIEGTGTSATVTNNKNGFTSKDDVSSYADRILQIFKEEKLYNFVKENAYKDLYISWDTIVSKIYNLYVKFIKENRR